MTETIIKNDIQINIEFDRTAIGKALHAEVRRLFDLDEYYNNLDDEECTEEIAVTARKVHEDYCKAHTTYENALKDWFVKGIEDGSIIDMRPDIG